MLLLTTLAMIWDIEVNFTLFIFLEDVWPLSSPSSPLSLNLLNIKQKLSICFKLSINSEFFLKSCL